MDPVGRHIADATGCHFDDPHLAFRAFHQHQSTPCLAHVDFGPVGVGMNVPACQEELVAHLARRHPRNADNQVADLLAGRIGGHFVGDLAAALRQQRFERFCVRIQPGQIVIGFLVMAIGAQKQPLCGIDTAQMRFSEFQNALPINLVILLH